MCVFCLSSHSDLGGFIESVDPVDKVLLIIGLQEELPHPSIDDLQVTKKKKRALGTKEKVKVHSSVTIRLQYTL